MGYATEGLAATVEIIGHRGSPRERRENTLPSFARAFEVGATAIELDVHGTRDGVVVVHHDAATNARPGDSGPVFTIAESAWEALRDVPIAGGRIPTLDVVLASVPANCTAYVEVKAPRIEEVVVSVIRAHSTRCAVHSFDHRIARRVRELAPDIPVGILQTSYPVDPLRPMRDVGARDLWQHWELIDQALIERVHEHGGRVIAWTANDPAVVSVLVRWGIDGICSDVPAAMRSLVDDLAR